MELDDLEVAAPFPAPLGDPLGHVGLSGAGRALKDCLPLVLQPVYDLLQPLALPKQFLGNDFDIRGRPWVAGRDRIVIFSVRRPDPPNQRLRVKTVSQWQVPFGRLLDEPVEKPQGMFVQSGLVGLRLR